MINIQKNIYLLVFLAMLTPSLSGQDNYHEETDTALLTPVVQELALDLTKNKTKDREKTYAVYAWVAQNIEYDFLGVENVTLGFESSRVISEALEKRKGVCQHYAELFHALAAASGLKSIVVFGYTRQNGKIDKVPHAWNALMIDSAWYLFDPTWGSGYFDGSAYQHAFREKYFMVQPQQMISSHMPFDPLFQFLNNPVSHENFKKGKFIPGEQPIDFTNEINDYLSLPEEQQVKESMERIQDFGIANTMVRGYYSNLNRRHKVYVANQQVDLHNQAIELFNEVVTQYNQYASEMNARGGKFPENTGPTESQLKDMESKALEVQRLFNEVDAPARLAQTLSENRENLEMLIKQIQKEKNRLMNNK